MTAKQKAVFVAFKQILGPAPERIDPEQAAEYLRKVTAQREPDKETAEVR